MQLKRRHDSPFPPESALADRSHGGEGVETPYINPQPHDLRLDPWLKQPENRTCVPDDAELACLQEINLGAVDVIPEALFFRRHDGQDELWAAGLRHAAPGKPREEQLATAYQQGRVAWAGSQGTRATGAEILFRGNR